MGMKYNGDERHFWAPVRKPFGGWIAFKSSPSAPTPPDPAVTAAAQTKSNIDTANANANINRTNQVTPWGSLSYSHGDQPNSDGTYNWTATTQLSPEQQALLTSSNGISQSMANLGQSQLGNVTNALQTPIDFSKASSVDVNPLQSHVNTDGIPNYRTSVDGGPIQTSVAPSGTIQNGINTSGTEDLTRGANGGGIQSSIDTSNVHGLVGGDALAGTMGDAQKAAYNLQKAQLDPQYQQQQHDLENQLAQQGVMQNSDAWNRAMDNFSRQRDSAYSNAFNNSFANGLQAQGQLFGQGLAVNQNDFGQDATKGQFANAAQAQGFGQGATNANINNAASAQLAQQRLAQMLAGNTAQQQQFGQNLSSMEAGNAAQAQKYSQAANNAGLNNSVASTMFGQALQGAGLNNQTAGQDFAQSTADRERQLQEMQQQQQIPLNLLNALRTGSQVTTPTFGNTPQSNVAGTDIAGITNQNYANQMGAYNAQMQQQNGLTSGLFGLGGSGLGAFAGSDAGSALLASAF